MRANTINTTDKDSVWGWAAGGGIEYALREAWSRKAEYLYLGIRDDHVHCGAVGKGPGPTDCSVSTVPGACTPPRAL